MSDNPRLDAVTLACQFADMLSEKLPSFPSDNQRVIRSVIIAITELGESLIEADEYVEELRIAADAVRAEARCTIEDIRADYERVCCERDHLRDQRDNLRDQIEELAGRLNNQVQQYRSRAGIKT